jgi:glutamate 5-kinase
MAAAVGQSRLMAAYDKLFARKKCRIGQVLLTHDDLEHRRRHLNARNTLLKLLECGVIPVINENDVVSVDEIKFGDNDTLGSRSAMLLEADLLVLLTTVDGFHATDAKGRSRRVPSWTCHRRTLFPTRKAKADFSNRAAWPACYLRRRGRPHGTPSSSPTAARTASCSKSSRPKNCGTLKRLGSDESNGGLNHRRRWVAFFHHSPIGPHRHRRRRAPATPCSSAA